MLDTTGTVSGDAALAVRAFEAAGSMLKATIHEPTVPAGGKGLWGHKGWQLPAYIQHVFNDLVDKGHPHSGRTYGPAVGIVRNWSQGHDGKGHRVTASTQAAAQKAMRERDALQARSKSMTAERRAREGAAAAAARPLAWRRPRSRPGRVDSRVGLHDANG